jgi:hypothetical protein
MKRFGSYLVLFFILTLESCTFKSYNLSRGGTYDDDLYRVPVHNDQEFDNQDFSLARGQNRTVVVNNWNIGGFGLGLNPYNFHLPYYYNWSFGLDNYWDPFLFRYRNGLFFYNNPLGFNYYNYYPFYNPYWGGNLWYNNSWWGGYNRYPYYSWYCSNPINYRYRSMPRRGGVGFTNLSTPRPVVGSNFPRSDRSRRVFYSGRNNQTSRNLSSSSDRNRTYTPSTPRTYTPRTYTPSTPRTYTPRTYTPSSTPRTYTPSTPRTYTPSTPRTYTPRTYTPSTPRTYTPRTYTPSTPRTYTPRSRD